MDDDAGGGMRSSRPTASREIFHRADRVVRPYGGINGGAGSRRGEVTPPYGGSHPSGKMPLGRCGHRPLRKAGRRNASLPPRAKKRAENRSPFLALFFFASPIAAFAAPGAVAVTAAGLTPAHCTDGQHHAGDEHQNQQYIQQLQSSAPPTAKAMRLTSHATAHCSTTTPQVAQKLCNSRRTVAMAATQGV